MTAAPAEMAAPIAAAREKLIVALDFPAVAEAKTMVAALGDSVSFYKIGMELAYGGGLPFANELIDGGKAVFLDLKLHDIPTTVEKACANVARVGARFLTVHAYPQTMAAAARGAAGSGLKILGVTVLTSCDDADLAEAGFAFGVKALVARRANQARAAAIDGLILSAEELAPVRRLVGPGMILVTPGIRPASAEVGDQKRVATPAAAIRASADHLVVGRPITKAKDPRAAAEAMLAEIAGAEGQ